MLICPDCQGSFDWISDLDHCPVCSSVHLVRRLGETECRDCGYVRQRPATSSLPGHLATLTPEPGGARPAGQGGDGQGGDGQGGAGQGGEPAALQGLAQEVELALARVLGRTAGSAAGG
ncbi:MAG TPA: hypothetical protein VMV07_14385 [Streptosporangiaceae bacterium]|nr:hypothetical protein [Streptosporangiaceae bacterium]